MPAFQFTSTKRQRLSPLAASRCGSAAAVLRLSARSRPRRLAAPRHLQHRMHSSRLAGRKHATTRRKSPRSFRPAQERVLWQHIIEQQHPDLFDVNAIAGMARRSAQLIAEWHIPTEGDFVERSSGRTTISDLASNISAASATTRAGSRDPISGSLLPKWIASGYCSPDPVSIRRLQHHHPALEQLKRSLGGSRRTGAALFTASASARPSKILH